MPTLFSDIRSALLVLVALMPGVNAQPAPGTLAASPLYEQLAGFDRDLFAAYNRCDLDKFAGYFAPDVEFYHDQGGVSYSRREVVENTRKYICGKVRRELVHGTLEAYPIKDFGALALGEHRFCEIASGKCEGIAKFVLIWQNTGSSWRITRVLSFGHRAASD
jgi:Domain of unknown function (DUF4440)